MGDTQNRTTFEPSPMQKEAMNSAFSLGSNVVQQLGELGPFTGDFFAGPTPLEISGRNELLSNARALKQFSLGPETLDLARRTIRGDFLTPDANPALGATLDALTNRLDRNFTENIVPAVNTGFLKQGGGAWDSNRRGISNAQLGQRQQETTAETLAPILLSNYNTERQIQNQAPALLGGAGTNLLTQPSNIIGQVGTAYRGDEQLSLDNLFRQFMQRRQAILDPLAALPAFQSVIGGPGGTRIEPGVDTGTQILQALLGLTGIGTGLADIFRGD